MRVERITWFSGGLDSSARSGGNKFGWRDGFGASVTSEFGHRTVL